MSPRNHLIIHLRKKNNQITSKADHSDNITDLINNEVRLKTRKAIPLASKENNVGGILAKKSTKKVNNGLTSKLSKKNKEKTKENEPSGNAVNSGTSLTGTQNADAENGIENVIKPKKTKKKLKQDLPSKLSEEIEKTCEKTGIDSSGNGVDSGTSLTHTQNADLQENEEKIEQLDVTYFWEDDDVAFQLFEDSFDDPIELPSSPIKPEISPTQNLSQISSPAKVSSSIHVDESSPVAKKPKTTPTKRNGQTDKKVAQTKRGVKNKKMCAYKSMRQSDRLKLRNFECPICHEYFAEATIAYHASSCQVEIYRSGTAVINPISCGLCDQIFPSSQEHANHVKICDA